MWAIGTGKMATPEQAQGVHSFICSRMALPDVDGALPPVATADLGGLRAAEKAVLVTLMGEQGLDLD